MKKVYATLPAHLLLSPFNGFRQTCTHSLTQIVSVPSTLFILLQGLESTGFPVRSSCWE